MIASQFLRHATYIFRTQSTIKDPTTRVREQIDKTWRLQRPAIPHAHRTQKKPRANGGESHQGQVV